MPPPCEPPNAALAAVYRRLACTPQPVTSGCVRPLEAMHPAKKSSVICLTYAADLRGTCGRWSEKQGRSWRDPGFPQNGSQPALCISFNDVHSYVAWLARKTGKAYRLLTEAEWEYAARARTEPGAYPRYWFGNEEKDLCRYGNGLDQTAKNEIAGFKDLFKDLIAGFKDLKFTPTPCNDGYAYTSPVGSFPANGFGLYDMLGNAWTWTEDCYHGNYIGAPSDGLAWTSGDCNNRVVRGASWVESSWQLRAARRFGWYSIGRASNVGVRVVRTLTP
jgi:formylglycine-generating enzyme required for sulfatase activity